MKREQGRERGLTQRREGAKEEERNILPQRHEERGFLPRRRACCEMLAFEGREKSGKSLSHGRVRARCRGLHRHLCVFVLAPSRSAAPRVGNGCVCPCRSSRSPIPFNITS